MEQAGNFTLAVDAGWVADPISDDPHGHGGRRDFSLLIVDDSPRLRQEVHKLVSRLGFIADCREAENGVEAFKRVRERPPDLILCDLVRPSVDGFKFLGMVRAG